MGNKVTFTINFPGQEPITKSVDLDIAQAWMESKGIADIESAINSVLFPIIKEGCDVLANKRVAEALEAK